MSPQLAHSAVLGVLTATPTPLPVASAVIHEGWVLKKRRKKMQGFARRYFVLYQSGLLAYSFEPNQPVRDQLSLHHAAISTAPGRKDIHIDSSTATFHLKCLSTEDFNTWMAEFRKFITMGTEMRRSASVRLARQGNVTISKSGALIEEIGLTLAELEEAFSLIECPPTKKQSKRPEKEKHKDHLKDAVSGLFKRASHQPSVHELVADGPPNPSLDLQLSPHQRASDALTKLRAQHTALSRSIFGLTFAEQGTLGHSTPLPTLPATTEEEEPPAEARLTPQNKRARHASLATTVSELSEWFDALDAMADGAQEFVMEGNASEQPSKMLTNDSRSSLERIVESNADTDSEEDHQEMQSCLNLSEVLEKVETVVPVTRRTELPARPVGDEGSLFAILKKNVGKDLSTISVPVSFNEPLTLLQRAAEEVEYYDLLTQAARATDPVERICLVAAFAVSSYAHTRHRSGRKGFTPLQAETFEDARMKFIAEKVRHNPLEMAYHAEGEGWDLTATSAGKTKFWGKSLEVIQLGSTHLRIAQDHFVWNKPSSFMRNIMVGTKYLEHCGQMSIENHTGSLRCILDFKQGGYWSTPNVVSGTIQDSSGDVLCQLEGKWDDQMAQTLDSSHFRVLWRATPFPKNTHEFYGFTSFGITLNEITNDIVKKLPPTDSRYRPDVRALEEGDPDTAEAEKLRVEELQRERRRLGKERQPRWFKQVGEEWEYVGGYWEAREKGWKEDRVDPLW
ncbi:hypothetical protein BDN72DRAFT_890690 [Pluteus cervinus]|uniref:Uncharacterized protein n=1 Tax=Pluteus cervinus TaxID=181527 RepID=A0ACD3BGF0_9AGAR|nr:hypothetical protein BDN72DRAFT_890690 [Pluteus cervinus]